MIDTTKENELVKENMGLVVDIAKSFAPPNQTELDEYIQQGLIGLLKSIRKFDPSMNNQLSTLAYRSIRWEILRYIYKKNKRSNEISLTHESDVAVFYDNDKLWEIIDNKLSETEIKVLQLRYEGYTFGEIGQELGGKTKNWASKVFNSAISRLREVNV